MPAAMDDCGYPSFSTEITELDTDSDSVVDTFFFDLTFDVQQDRVYCFDGDENQLPSKYRENESVLSDITSGDGDASHEYKRI